MRQLRDLEGVVDAAIEMRAEWIEAMDKEMGDPISSRGLTDEEFVQWFEAMMAASPVIQVVAARPPMTDWVPPGTVLSGPAWALAVMLPSTENAKREVARYKRLTGYRDPIAEAMNGAH